MGVVTLIYDHHVSRIAERLTDLQHHHLDRVVTTTHVHLDERRCLEVILLRGPARDDPRPGRRPDRHQGRRDRPARPRLGQTGSGKGELKSRARSPRPRSQPQGEVKSCLCWITFTPPWTSVTPGNHFTPGGRLELQTS